jgi:hypothetical protein
MSSTQPSFDLNTGRRLVRFDSFRARIPIAALGFNASAHD